MWVFTKTGFYSIVNHRDVPDAFLVRARRREDLVDLVAGNPLDVERIEDDPRADYRWRLVVDKSVVRDILVEQLDDIDYDTNVKHRLDKDDPNRHHAMLRVWTAMLDFQFEGEADDSEGW